VPRTVGSFDLFAHGLLDSPAVDKNIPLCCHLWPLKMLFNAHLARSHLANVSFLLAVETVSQTAHSS
jgi:hypothetical protein